VIDGYTLANLVVLLSLSPGNYAGLPRLIHQMATGDGTAAATALLGTVSPPGLTGYGLTYGVFCREQAAYTDAATVTATAKRALPGFPDPVLSLPPQAPRLLDECPVWNVGTAPPSVHDVTRSDLPVLLLAGTLDAVTPPSQAGAAAQGLTHSRVIRFPGLGHDVPRASACARSIVASFLDAPDHTDTTCLESVRVPDFATG
jgi:pimeloyl-ACP methyl ester carboxylesterase